MFDFLKGLFSKEEEKIVDEMKKTEFNGFLNEENNNMDNIDKYEEDIPDIEEEENDYDDNEDYDDINDYITEEEDEYEVNIFDEEYNEGNLEKVFMYDNEKLRVSFRSDEDMILFNANDEDILLIRVNTGYSISETLEYFEEIRLMETAVDLTKEYTNTPTLDHEVLKKITDVLIFVNEDEEDEMVKFVNDNAGDLLINLAYETNNGWNIIKIFNNVIEQGTVYMDESKVSEFPELTVITDNDNEVFIDFNDLENIKLYINGIFITAFHPYFDIDLKETKEYIINENLIEKFIGEFEKDSDLEVLDITAIKETIEKIKEEIEEGFVTQYYTDDNPLPTNIDLSDEIFHVHVQESNLLALMNDNIDTNSEEEIEEGFVTQYYADDDEDDIPYYGDWINDPENLAKLQEKRLETKAPLKFEERDLYSFNMNFNQPDKEPVSLFFRVKNLSDNDAIKISMDTRSFTINLNEDQLDKEIMFDVRTNVLEIINLILIERLREKGEDTVDDIFEIMYKTFDQATTYNKLIDEALSAYELYCNTSIAPVTDKNIMDKAIEITAKRSHYDNELLFKEVEKNI